MQPVSTQNTLEDRIRLVEHENLGSKNRRTFPEVLQHQTQCKFFQQQLSNQIYNVRQFNFKISAKKAPVAKPSSPLSSLASTNPKNLKGNYCLGIIPAVNAAHPQSKAPKFPCQIDLQDQLPQC